MATETLTATLQANDRLSGALREVASSARVAARGLDAVDNKLLDIAEASAVAQEGLEEVSSELTDLIGSGGASQTALDQVSDELGEIRNNTAVSAAALSGLAVNLGVVGGTAEGSAQGLNEFGDEAKDAMSDMFGLSAANLQEAVSAGVAGSTSQAASEGVDELGDEAREAAGSMFAASGAADALSLSSSALSINVGAFTIALRNLTTQIPLLVTSLGGLVTAFTGVASAALLAAGGVSAVLAGGFLAEAENLSGSLEDSENTLKAIQAIGGEIKDMMIEAIQPLLDAEGIVDRFRSSMETLATTVQMFSGSIAAAFSNAEEEFFTIAEFMDIVGGSWLDNLESIVDGFMILWNSVGPIFTDMLVYMMDEFEDFATFVSKITRRIAIVFGSAGEGIGGFINQLIELGINIASGIAPVMSMFLDLVADIARAFNDMEDGTVGTITKVLVLTFALNRVAGALGAILSPLTAGIAGLAKAADKAGSFTDAILNTAGAFGNFTKEFVGGFSALSKALSVILPQNMGYITQMQQAAASTDDNIKPLRSLTTAMRGYLSTAAGFVNIDLEGKLDRMRSAFSGASGQAVSYAGSLLQAARPSNLLNKATDSLASGIGSLRESWLSFTAVTTGGMSMSLDEMRAANMAQQDMITGFEGLQVRAGNARDRIIGVGSSIRQSLAGDLAVVQGRIAQGFDSLRDKWVSFTAITNAGVDVDLSTIRSANLSMTNDVLTGWEGLTRKIELMSWNMLLAIDGAFDDAADGIRSSLNTINDTTFDDLKAGLFNSIDDAKAGVRARAMAIGGSIKRGIYSEVDGLDVGDRLSIGPGLTDDEIEGFDVNPDRLGASTFDRLKFRVRDSLDATMARVKSFGGSIKDFGSAIRGAGAGAVDSFVGGIHDLTDGIESAVGSVKTFVGGVRDSIPSLAGLQKGLRNVSFSAMDMKDAINSSFASIVGSMRNTIPATASLGSAWSILATRVGAAGGAFARLRNVMQIAKAVMAGQITLTKGLSAAQVALGLTSNASAGGILNLAAAKSALLTITGLLSGGVWALVGALGSLATITGVLVGVLGVVVVVGGAVVAMLASLGASGKDAEEIVSGLLSKMKQLGSAVMPLFRESGEMILDFLDAIMAPIGALVSGFKDIGVALGLVDESAGEQGGFKTLLGMIDSGVAAIKPVVDVIGRLAQLVGQELAVQIGKATDWLAQFLEKIDAAGKVQQYIATVQRISDKISGLKDDVMDFIDTFVGSFMSTLENTMSQISSIMDVFRDAFGLGGGEGSDGGIFTTLMNVLEGFYNVAISLVGPVLDFLGSLFSALYGVIDVLVTVLAGLIKIIIRAVAAGMDLTNWLLDLVGMDLGDIFDGMVDGAMMLVDALIWVIDMLTKMIDVGALVGDAIVKNFMAIWDALTTILSGGNIIQAVRNAAEQIGQNFGEALGNALGANKFRIPEVTIGGGSIAGQDIPEVTLGGQTFSLIDGDVGSSGGSGGGGGQSVGGMISSAPSNEISMDDVTGGAQVAKDVAGEGAQRAGISVPGGQGVEYNEGDVQNNYQQNISADPEDKGTLSRVVKDAMEEANSFERRQQGGQ